jgi:hypothetical protein
MSLPAFDERDRFFASRGHRHFKAAFVKRVLDDTLNGLVVFNDQDYRQSLHALLPNIWGRNDVAHSTTRKRNYSCLRKARR